MNKKSFQKIRKHYREDHYEDSKPNWKICKGKASFPEFRARAKGKELGQRPYHCDLCDQWHLTEDVD